MIVVNVFNKRRTQHSVGSVLLFVFVFFLALCQEIVFKTTLKMVRNFLFLFLDHDTSLFGSN